MSKRFCILCVGLSMFSFFALKSVNASDDKDPASLREYTFPAWWGISIFEQTKLPAIHDLPRRTHAKIDEFYIKRITEFLGHKLDDEKHMESIQKTSDVFFTLYAMHKNKIEEQNEREANSEEITTILKSIDKELRTKIDKGDFELDITEDLKK